MTNKILNLDISKEPKLNPIIYGRVGDGGSQRVTLNTSKRDEQLDLTGYTITFEGVTSGGKTKVFDSDNVVVTSEGLKKGTFDYVFPNMAFAVKGKYERAYFSFIKDGIRDTSGEIEIIVFGNADINAAEAETVITEYNKLFAELQELQKNNIADLQEQAETIQTRLSELAKRLDELELGVRLHDAYAWSADGTDRFTKVYPGKNIFNHIADYPDNLIWNRELVCYEAVSPNIAFAMFYVGKLITDLSKTYTMSFEIEALNDTIQFANSVFYLNSTTSVQHNKPILIKDKKVKVFATFKLTTTSNTLVHTYFNKSPQGAFRIYNVKVEEGNTQTIYTTPPSEDPINAVPQYRGIGLVDSDNPADYSWQAEDNTIAKKATLDSHTENISNPHKVTKTQIGLGNVDNYGVATQSEAEVGLAENKFVTPLGVKQHTDKRIATASDVLIGTNKKQLLTPYSTKLFYDSQEKNRSKFLSVRTKYAAHRGNNSVFPENSLEAFKSVTRHEFFECDVQVTKDDEWIVMHDTTVDRTTNGTGNVKDLTYAQIRALKIDAGSNINNLQDWQKVVPDLSDVCQCARYGKSIPMIEIKGGAGEVYSDAQLDKFMDTLHQFRMLPDGAIVISFDADILARIRQRSNEIELMWIQNSIPLNGLDICKANRFGIDVAYNSATLTKENITAFHKAGLLVGTWTTPEENHQQQEGLGVDIITTNSKSGFLRYGSLTLKNGFTGNTNNGLQNYNVVEEISPGQVRAYFNVLNGVNTSDSLVATFPDWAVPFANSWQFCNIRTSSGSILATANVMGKTSENAGIWIGLNWTQRTTWAAGVLHWSLY
ncbi:glycerophosphodiester phosphodiesterase family protein [Enterococcus viikkiensis]|uniref:glycerophosphodiester phosphodiesterase family protein n=1 Tax=Enterococcus viikkiensis TaxID=930854 RepID=UPI0010F95746|nr:glycerophosphodiester phosphodiesterase family protein [Enterococcus viikkiensis]